MATTTGRAAPLSPAERRESLVEAFLELARRHGRVPTTSEIAAAAGVAEGTIFRAFPSKEALQTAAVEAAFCPAGARREFLAIDRSQPVRDRLVDFAAALQRRIRDVLDLMGALGLSQPPPVHQHAACLETGRHVPSEPSDGCRALHVDLYEAVTDLVPSEEITVTPHQLLHRIRLLSFSGSHPGIAHGELLTPEEVVDTVLYGVAARPGPKSD
ncbi:TetR/AcrR family transcriptional regulator [Intrasporangium sp. DVR]|uniref:TetR/AcrR family transcriptional regulator n=1 Tax=Intrasporangium sp. DVR TaxID=3127867 RepID=UPI00333EDC56